MRLKQHGTGAIRRILSSSRLAHFASSRSHFWLFHATALSDASQPASAINRLGLVGRSCVFIAASLLMPAFVIAADQKLADLKYASHNLDHGALVIRTSGSATIRITFVSTGSARVQVFRSGVAINNPSPAVAIQPAPAVGSHILDQADALIIQNTDLTLRVAKNHLRVDAYDGANQNVISLESPDDGTVWDESTGAIRHSRVLKQTEHLYGLGQDNSNHGTLDRRGTVDEMWTGQQIRSGNVTAEYPVPFYLSTGINGRGYGCFVDNVWRMKFDMGKSRQDRLTWSAPGGPIDYYLINGPSFKKVIDRYTELTGRPSMLPLWAFGFWQSRCFYNSFLEMKQTSDHLQADGIPLDVMVIDSAWSKTDMDFLFSDKFLGGKAVSDWTSYFHKRGLKLILSTKGPMITPVSENYAQARQLGLFATDGQGQPMVCGYYGGHLMDFTHPSMETWLATQLSPLLQDGMDGWWLDLVEPEGEPPQAVYHEGKSADIHNTFPLLQYRDYYDINKRYAPDERPVILGRAATAGTQRYSGIVWTGDINSDWPTFRAHIPEAQNAGLSGLPYWTNDSGGFINGFLHHDRYGDHAELYERWFEFTCLAPIARAHKAGPSAPFDYGPEVEATAKKYLQLRYRLMPYIYTVAHETAMTGLPMLRPLVLEYQDDPGSATAKTEYLFGNDLLVAPVIWAKATARPVYFPPGSWISLEDGYEVTGPKTVVVAAPRNRLPLFVREGAIIPQAPEMAHTGERPWDPVTLEVWPKEKSSATLYEDDTHTQKYEGGESTTTEFECTQVQDQSVSFHIKPSNNRFGPNEWVAKMHLTAVPHSLILDGSSLNHSGWSWDEPTRTLTATIPGHHLARNLKIELDGSARSRPAPPNIPLPALNEDDAAQAPRQIAQFLPPPKLPGRIEAANFDKGGEGLAYHVKQPGNPGGLYRQEGVPIIASTDTGGGYAVSGLQQGDWLAFTINTGDGGMFELSARVLPGSEEGAMSLLLDRTEPLATMSAPGTQQPKQAWTSVKGNSSFYLPAGEQMLCIRVDKPGFQMANFILTAAQKGN